MYREQTTKTNANIGNCNSGHVLPCRSIVYMSGRGGSRASYGGGTQIFLAVD